MIKINIILITFIGKLFSLLNKKMFLVSSPHAKDLQVPLLRVAQTILELEGIDISSILLFFLKKINFTYFF